LLSAAGLAAASVAFIFVGALLADSATVGRTTVILLVSVAGYVGACALSARVAPACLSGNEDERAMLRVYCSMAAMPVVATGVAYLAPWESVWWLVALLGAAVTAYSSFVGARCLLPYEAARRHRTAVLTTALASAPVLAVAALRSAA
jgi:hypothetical protein